MAEPIYQRFTEYFVEVTKKMVVGDPLDERSDMGPMISEQQAQRIEQWVDAACAAGATVQAGHRREGAIYYPTVLTDVPRHAQVWKEEVFAPVVTIAPFGNLKEAIALANDSESSLHAGLFTNHLETALDVSDALDAGGVMINDSSDFRFDGMPFGGSKYGSLGREGVKFSIAEMSQPKVVCFRR